MPLGYVTFNGQSAFLGLLQLWYKTRRGARSELPTNDSENHSIGRSSVPFGGDIRLFSPRLSQ